MSDSNGDSLTKIRIASRADQLRVVRSSVSLAAAKAGCGEQCIHDIIVAVDEACQNVIRHAYNDDPQGEIVVEVKKRGDHLELDILDFAAPVDTSKIKPRPLEEVRPGGLGTHFIQACMDEAVFLNPPNGVGNLLRLIKRIS